MIVQFLVVVLMSCWCDGTALNYSNFRVWGPGLDPGFNLPVRYFYIQAVDDEFNK
jgi:hypothetical protein